MSGEPYLSSDDSALLTGAIRGAFGNSCLEIGAGNGGTLVCLAKTFGVAVGTDLQRPRMRDWRADSNYLLADAATCFRDSCFDLVAFNPPYLRSTGVGDRTVEGGDSLEVPMHFFREALRVVSRTGRVVFLLNDEADIEDFEAECSKSGFELRRLTSRRVFFEEISVYEASQHQKAERPQSVAH